ncbi:hypothetical protein WJX73_002889 [Symbiochloris irregularis]|uniref:Amino acid transporter n=1 Tax=Symbiochloris irregularis TaxID=706552 RepID=A0AAW1PV59_9CHLO
MVSLLLSIQDPARLLSGNANGFVAAQIFYDAFDARYGDGRPGTVLMVALPGSAIFVALIATTVAGSRMVYSFAKSGGIPFGAFFSVVDRRTHTPICTVWLLTFVAFILGLPLLLSSAAFGAVTAMANAALLISYAIPIACRHTFCRNNFANAPFSLGRWSEPIGWCSLGWTVLSVVAFSLPTQYPVTATPQNYGCAILVLVFLGCLLAWHLPSHDAAVFFQSIGGSHSWIEACKNTGTILVHSFPS